MLTSPFFEGVEGVPMLATGAVRGSFTGVKPPSMFQSNGIGPLLAATMITLDDVSDTGEDPTEDSGEVSVETITAGVLLGVATSPWTPLEGESAGAGAGETLREFDGEKAAGVATSSKTMKPLGLDKLRT